jgi:hypothetical protein
MKPTCCNCSNGKLVDIFINPLFSCPHSSGIFRAPEYSCDKHSPRLCGNCGNGQPRSELVLECSATLNIPPSWPKSGRVLRLGMAATDGAGCQCWKPKDNQ